MSAVESPPTPAAGERPGPAPSGWAAAALERAPHRRSDRRWAAALGFLLARVVAALLGAVGVGFLYAAGARLFDRRVGLLAAGLLAVGFLPVFYAHLALNDVPTLAGVCLALIGIGGIVRRGATPDYVLAGVGLGLGCATKYTAGIVLLPLVAAAFASGRPPLGRLALSGAVALGTFIVANPYALLDFSGFVDGLNHQSTAAAGAVVLAWQRPRLFWVLVPAPVLFLLFMGT